ncbi:MAG: hypothetical protein JNL33_16560 [Betaproteobacteria bacterium]|nr:hypothetical protein [Betaproteobacteria bacterium]
MAAMASSTIIRSRARHAVFTARRVSHSAQLTFYIAHELGHIALGHVNGNDAIVEDLDTSAEGDQNQSSTDDEELAADRYALELLTGSPEFHVTHALSAGSPAELARVAIEAGPILGVDPALLALCFARSTNKWGLAMASLRKIGDPNRPAGRIVNQALRSQIEVGELSHEEVSYLDAVASV